jgi:hypothetical protein
MFYALEGIGRLLLGAALEADRFDGTQYRFPPHLSWQVEVRRHGRLITERDAMAGRGQLVDISPKS